MRSSSPRPWTTRTSTTATKRFIALARAKYIEEHEDEILEAAAELYKQEHEEDEDFKQAAVRLKADEL